MPYSNLLLHSQHHPGLSGVCPITSALEAFAVRAQMCAVAQSTIDIQYYVWRPDLTGTYLLYCVLKAARRGVRLRLLLDDFGCGGIDGTLAVLADHPNIEIRLINPFRWRRFRYLNLLHDFARLNRRMHNKSFTIDNKITIVGGRNIADEYFGAKDGDLFSDLDVVAVGPVVNAVGHDFNRFWNSPVAVDVGHLLGKPSTRQRRRFEHRIARLLRDSRIKPYEEAANDAALRSAWLEDVEHYEWARTTMLSDNPEKLRGKIEPDDLVMTGLRRIFGQPQRHLELVTAYFVPSADGLTLLAEMAQRGIHVQVLTNSLEATDVAAVHAGYSRYRKALIAAGVSLFEMKRIQKIPRVRSYGRRGQRRRLLSSAGTSLHSKTLAIDGQTLFVGSFNFDPRSNLLNTEMGFVIESPVLAGELHQGFSLRVPQMAYQAQLDSKGRLYWTQESEAQGRQVFYREPRAPLWRRFLVRVLAYLPIERLL